MSIFEVDQLKNASRKSGSKKNAESIHMIPEKQDRKPLNIAIVGGGKSCYDLLKLLGKDRLSGLDVNILGVSDIDPNAPGLRYAGELGLFTAATLEELYTLDGIDLILDLTGSAGVRDEITRTKPSGISVIDHTGAKLLTGLIRMESDNGGPGRVGPRYENRFGKDTQVILDSLPYRIMVVNMDMTIDMVNQTFLREYGLKRENVHGKRCYELRFGLDKPCEETWGTCFSEDQRQELRKKGLFSTFKEYRGENGGTRFDVITIAPVLNERGEIVQLLEASRDVTERVRLEKDAQKSTVFLQNVIQSTVDGIVVVDTKGYILVFNEGMEQLTGYSAREIMEKGHLENFYNMDVAKDNMKKMRSDKYGPPGKLNPTSMTVTAKNGEEIPVTLSASLIRIDGKEIGSVGVFTDMREVLKMRKDLEEAHLQLVESEKIASVGRMAAGVAHEINNPLAGIMIYAELLKKDLEEEAQYLADIQEIINQTIRCKKIVSELLEFSRQSIGKASSFSIEQLITKSLNLLINQAIFQDIQVSEDIESHMPAMVGDMGQLQQVLTNLFINAADAMGGKGRLDIQAKYDTEGSRFLIVVSDSGPGIPEELRDKIFDIFFTTKPVGKGTGLGLSISRNIIKLHGGSIVVDCPPTGGTSFIIELPLGFVAQPSQEPVFVGLDE